MSSVIAFDPTTTDHREWDRLAKSKWLFPMIPIAKDNVMPKQQDPSISNFKSQLSLAQSTKTTKKTIQEAATKRMIKRATVHE